MALQDDDLVKKQQKQELERISEKASHEEATPKKATMRQKLKKISKRATHETLLWLPKRSYEQFVAWKGDWGKGRAFVVGETGASVKNRGGGHPAGGDRLLISGNKIAVERAINMIVTQSLTAVASPDDYNILNEQDKNILSEEDKKVLEKELEQKSQKKSLHKEAQAKPMSSLGASSGGGSHDKDADGNPMWDLGNMKKVVVRSFMGKKKKKSPSQIRREDIRREARKLKIAEKVVEVPPSATPQEAAEKTAVTAVPQQESTTLEFKCEQCDYKSTSERAQRDGGQGRRACP